MAEIISNQFTSTVSRTTTSTTQEILSNQFTTTINRQSDVPASLGDKLSTVVNIYKKGSLLTPVSGIPSTNEYKVTITNTTGCTAALQSDNKTIKLLTLTSNTGLIDVSINIENKSTYIKSIPVGSITDTQEINGSISKVEQTANKINWLVSSGTSSSNMTLTSELYSLISKNISLKADRISLEGLVTANQNFKINENGTITARGADIVGALTSTRNIVLYTNDRAFRGIDTQGTECTLAHIDDVNCCRFGWGSWIGNSSLAYNQGSEFMGGKKAVLRSQENTYLVCNGMTYDSIGGGSLVFLNNSSGDYAFRPVTTNKDYLGSSTYRWIKLYSTSAADVSSDRELKENIKYLQTDNLNASAYTIENNTEITYDNMYKFIRDDLSLTQYNYKDVNSSEIGFIAQDLLVNTDGSDNTIGQLIIDPKHAVDDSIENGEKSYLSYNTGIYTHVIAGALKQAIIKIDKLEKRINDLEELIYQE